MRRWRSIRILLAELALALAAIATGMALFRFGVLAPIEHWLTPEKAPSPVLRPVGMIGSALLGYWLFARYHERRAVTELVPRPWHMAIAALAGSALILVTILALFAMGFYEVQRYRGFAGAPRVMGTIFVAALLEELVFRGVVFRLLERQAGTLWALSIQSVVFGALHLFNSDTTFMTLLSVTLLGAFWTMVFVWSRNLWVVACNHAAWNTAIFLSGIPLSGTQEWRSSAPFESRYEGPVWLTGGGFGPEDSLLNVLFMALVLAGMITVAMRKERIVRKPIGTETSSRAAASEA